MFLVSKFLSFYGYAVRRFNFVEGFAVLWLRRFYVSKFQV